MLDYLFAFLEWLHVLAVVIWVGGGIFFGMIFIPSLSSAEEKWAGQLRNTVGKSFGRFAWTMIAIIGFTGIAMLYVYGFPPSWFFFNTFYGNLLIGKTVLFLLTIVFALMIVRLAKQIDGSNDRQLIAKNTAKIDTLSFLNVLLGVVIVFLAVLL